MLRYIVYIVLTFLIVDHLYTHWGPEIINRVASSFMGRDVTLVDEPPHRESIIDRAVKEVKELIGV
ncbi:MAG: hypothetical protein Q9N26_03880 [Aquificota bacterium]|nr:hypothetical protein [Aquificota bacterium]